MNLEFKLNYYFEKYKDTSFKTNEIFKRDFIKKEGDFTLLNELVLLINKYQVKKFGTNLCNECNINGLSKKISKRISNANRKKYGTIEERKRRKSKYANWIRKINC